MSDSNGQILLYTSGDTIWNRNHQVMTNGTGLLGHSSSSHSAVIVPKPGSSSIFYVFTVAEVAGPNGINYSIVDMNMSAGLGAVTTKNVQILTPALEKLTAVRHATQNAYWVIIHGFNDNAFYSYLVNSSGISSVPVKSNCGVSITSTNNCRGCIKASPDGKKLALAHSWLGVVELFNFNNATGVVSNAVSFSNFNSLAPYGVEFSPSSQLLYVGEWYGGLNIYQYNLTASDIANSRTIIGTDSGANIGALQLGPDGKIYVAADGKYYLGIIKNPDILGTACSFALSGIRLAGKKSRLGLPVFNQSYFLSDQFVFINVCKGDSTQFTNLATNYDSLKWDFGDVATGALNFSKAANPKHKYSKKGNFTVKLDVYKKGIKGSYFKGITIDQPSIYLGKDTAICPGSNIILDVTASNTTYLWQDNSTKPTFNVTQCGTFHVEITQNKCKNSDTIIVSYRKLPTVDLGNDTALCEGDSLKMDVTAPNSTYLWQDKSTIPTTIITEQGTYWVKLTQNKCSNSDTIVVSYKTLPIVDLGSDTSLCQGDTLQIKATNLVAQVLWQNGSTKPVFVVSKQGTYWAKVTVNGCNNSDTINISYKALPKFNLGNDTSLCMGETILLDATMPNASYRWQDYSTNPSLVVSKQGIYWVKFTVNNCSNTDTIFVKFKSLPAINLGNDTNLCPSETITLDATMPNASYLWQDYSTNPTFVASQQGTYWVAVTVSNCVNTDTINIEDLISPSLNLGNDTIVCQRAKFILHAENKNADYSWQDGSANSTFNVKESGRYWVEAKNKCGTASDTITIEMVKCYCYLFVPDAFSPNADSINDKFSPISNCAFSEYSFLIYSRWGEKLFETSDPNKFWDGTFNGIMEPTGVYVYLVKYKFEYDAGKIKYGTVTLIR